MIPTINNNKILTLIFKNENILTKMINIMITKNNKIDNNKL
jgi:hypothetical protein